MPKIRIHSVFYMGPNKYTVIASNSVSWLQNIPGLLKLEAFAQALLADGRRGIDCAQDNDFPFVGAAPDDQLNIRFYDSIGGRCSFELFGRAVGVGGWICPENITHVSDILCTARIEDMPIFRHHKEAKPPETKRSVGKSIQEMSFYERRLAESRAKSRQEDASAPVRRAFEFL